MALCVNDVAEAVSFPLKKKPKRNRARSKATIPDCLCLASLAGQHSLSNSRDISAMDTLPLNGNFNNSYSLRDDDYEAVGVRGPVELGGLNLGDAAFEKMIISEIVQNNLRPRGVSKGGREGPREREHRAAAATQHARVMVDSEDDAIVADLPEAPSPPRGGGRGGHATLELLLHPHHKEALEAPLLPQRTHSLLYSAQKGPRQPEGPETVSPLEAPGPRCSPPSNNNNRDSLYTSMPNLKDSPSSSPYPPDEEEEEDEEAVAEEEEQLSPSPIRSDGEDGYHKSMPELGEAPPPVSYYHINRGSSDGCIISPNYEDSTPEGEAEAVVAAAAGDGQMQLITSL